MLKKEHRRLRSKHVRKQDQKMARQEEKESSSSGGCMDSGGGAGETIHSESRAGSSSTLMPKKW